MKRLHPSGPLGEVHLFSTANFKILSDPLSLGDVCAWKNRLKFVRDTRVLSVQLGVIFVNSK